jgi:crotonobetainyl-CoA:carnitine CoA-transferase CaiB-like acyl-CoA transferase
MLADMGAEVIRIEPSGGPFFKDPASDMLARGKFDLKTPGDLATTHEQIEAMIEDGVTRLRWSEKYLPE